MTIPYLMNCDHCPAGWCLACVKDQGERLVAVENALERLMAADPPFVSKPVGMEGSEARRQQEEHIAAWDHAAKVLRSNR